MELAKQAVEQNTKPGVVGYRAQATARIWLDLGEDTLFPPYADDVLRSFRGVTAQRGTLWVTVEAAGELGLHGSADEFAEGLARALPDVEAASVRGLVTGSIRRVPVRGRVPTRGAYNALTVLGPLADVGIGAGFQYWTDYQNPYLTEGQKLGRAAISGVSEGLGALIVTAAVCGSTGGVGCVVIAGVSGGFAGGAFARSIVFPFFGLQPERHLQELLR